MMNKILNKAGKRVKWFLPCYLLVFLPLLANAQSDRQLIRQGNKQFRAGNYAESEVLYRKAVEKNPRNSQAYFNLGNALLGQRKDSSAVSQFEASAKLETNPIRKAKAYHNMGVVCQGKKMFCEAIEAYKEALRNNPTDDETRYNLALCKRQQQQQKQQKQNQDNQQNQNKDQKQDKDKQDKDKQDQQKQDQQKKDQQKQQQQQQKQQMSRENAEQMLNAAIQEEKQTQERMKKAQQPNNRKLEKNW